MGDFSSFHRFIVKGQYVMGQWIAEITLKKNIIQIQKRGPRDIQVRINGQPVEFSRSNGWTVMAKDINDQSDIAEVQYTPVGGWESVRIRAPRFLLEEVNTDGQNIEVVPSAELKGKLGGLCGNNQKPIRSVETLAGHCVYSKPELEIASWVVPTWIIPTSYSTLSPSLLSQLKKETEIVSKVPITSCGPSCKSGADGYVEKEVPFVCPQAGHGYDEVIRAKIHFGVLMPELERLPTTFTRKIRMPAHCVHAL